MIRQDKGNYSYNSSSKVLYVNIVNIFYSDKHTAAKPQDVTVYPIFVNMINIFRQL